MEELKFVRTVLKVSLYGEKFEMTRPNIEQAESFKDKLEELEDEKSSSKLMAFMRSLLAEFGLPEDKSKQMEMEHFQKLITALIGEKKS